MYHYMNNIYSKYWFETIVVRMNFDLHFQTMVEFIVDYSDFIKIIFCRYSTKLMNEVYIISTVIELQNTCVFDEIVLHVYQDMK